MLENDNDNDIRKKKYFKLSSQIAQFDNTQLCSLLRDSESNESSSGWGTNNIIVFGQHKVFVKSIPVTDIEYDNREDILVKVREATKHYIGLSLMQRVPVLDKDGTPLMPTKASRARRMVKGGKAVGKRNKLGIYYIQLIDKPSGRETQSISVGIDPGKYYSGIGIHSNIFR